MPRSTPPLRLTQLGLINSYLVPDEGGLTLIDAGLPGLRRRVQQASRHLGLPLRRILLTHAHDDHFGSVNELLLDWPDADLLLGEADLPLLRDRSTITATPARLLRDGDRVGALHVIATPGHSPGQVAYHDERDGILYAGDAYYNVPSLHVVSVLHPLFPLPTLGTWNAGRALDSARKLSDLNVSWLAAGHGRPIPNAQPAMRRAVNAAEQADPPAPFTRALGAVMGRVMRRGRPHRVC